jgi:pimeloyl-ACP methyl ester carboxylesterase
MTMTPRDLLDTSVAQLETLVAFLSDQLGETGGSPPMQSDALELRACKEVLFSLSVLIPKVQVARRASAGLADAGHAGGHSVLPGAGHLSMLETPQAVAHAIEQFVRKL